MVRDLAHRTLARLGYTVLEARDGAQALQRCEDYDGPVYLLLTDVVMPGGMSGPELAERLAVLCPQAKVLYMSGYIDDAIVRHGRLGSSALLMQKPFTPAMLAQKVRDVLGKATPSGQDQRF